jgi:hypothetical protein
MANSKISALTSATTPLAGTEVLPIVQSSTTKQVSVANLTAGRTQTSNGIVQGTAATGYNFTANTPAAGMTSQLLNWYEEGTWTPTITFATPGDLAITYSATIRVGTYTRIGNRIIVNFNVATTAFTFTTASGSLQISGLPFTAQNLTASTSAGAMVWGGITKIGYTQVTPRVQPNTILIDFVASGSAVTQSAVVATDTPSGGTMTLRGTITYEI